MAMKLINPTDADNLAFKHNKERKALKEVGKKSALNKFKIRRWEYRIRASIFSKFFQNTLFFLILK